MMSLLLAGCNGELSIVDPAGPAARAIATLWWVMLAGATAIFTLVMVLLFGAFRAKRTAAPESAQERFWILGLGLVFSLGVLGALLAYGLLTGERLMPRAGAGLIRVEAEAQRWKWRFAYPGSGAAETEDVLHIPAGRPVDVAITSRDVVHSFWVPRLAGKLDAIPGRVNVLRIEADTPGTYRGLTAEYNGTGYSGHVFTVRVHDAEDWAAFLEGSMK